MEVLLVEFQVHHEHVDRFAAALRGNAVQSLERERGCRRFDICRCPSDPSVFLLYELYDDADAVQAHLGADHFVAFDAASRPWVRRKIVRRLRLDGETLT